MLLELGHQILRFWPALEKLYCIFPVMGLYDTEHYFNDFPAVSEISAVL
jgi:hypothetical protein